MATRKVEDQKQLNWHALDSEETLSRLDSSTQGLTNEEVQKRQKKYGLNKLPVKKTSLFKIFFSQFKNPIIYVLIVAAIISLFLDEKTDAAFIAAVLLLNAVIGFIQEARAEKSAASLQKLLKVIVRTQRDGREESIDADELVPGDIVFLESGNRVPADLRIIRSNELSIDESLLTGESVAVQKNAESIAEDIAVSDRSNMAYAASTVMNGRALGVVVGTGFFTEVGSIAQAVSGSDSFKPPLVIRMERFTKQLAQLTLAAIVVLAVIAFFQGMAYDEIFFFAVALAVSAIPEGLPVAITVALAIATNRMAKKNVIVRKLTAVEGLGSCTMIASDKTGTLTVNKQTVKRILLPEGHIYDVTGEGYSGVGEIIAPDERELAENEKELLYNLSRTGSIVNEGRLHLENDHWNFQGDAVDISFLALAYKAGLKPHEEQEGIEIVAELPFESERKFAATWYKDADQHQLAVKGAVETVLPLCDYAHSLDGKKAIDAAAIEAQANELTSQGYRVIAVALGEVMKNVSEKDALKALENPLALYGLVGLIDPLRPEVKDAVRTVKQAGVDVAIVTGDHPLTALAIARELGIADQLEDVIIGPELEEVGIDDMEKLGEAVRGKHVFARVAPLQKMHITEALNRSGHFVAVTGDGVNDVPALKRANIGVAMGSGTDLAKETAEIIVTDDNFRSIKAGIEGGRFAYDNIRKVTYLLISTGAAEIVLFLLSLLFGLPLPLAAVQLLWLNLVTNGIQDVALAFEGGEPLAMNRPPRDPEEGIFNKLMIQQTIVSGLAIGLTAFGAWHYMIYHGFDELHAKTILLMLMVFLENVHVFNCRSEHTSAFKTPLSRNWVVVGGVIVAQLIHIAASNIPVMQGILEIEAIGLRDWFFLFVLSLTVLIAMEIFKWWKKRTAKAELVQA